MANKGRPPEGLKQHQFYMFHDINAGTNFRMDGSEQLGKKALGGKKAAKAKWKEYKALQVDKRNKREAGHRRLHESTLVYPQDLAGNEFYPEAIKFTVFKRKGASLEKIQDEMGQIATLGKIAALAKKEGQEPAKKIQEELGLAEAALASAKLAKSTKKSGETDQAWQERVGISAREKVESIHSKIKFWKAAKKYEIGEDSSAVDIMGKALGKIGNIGSEATTGLRQTAFNDLKNVNETSKILGEVYMNMPNEINFNEEAQWSEAPLGLIGGLAKGPAGEAAVTTAFSQFSNVAGGGTASLAALALKMGKSGAMAAGVLGMLGGDAMQKALESGTGQIANPYKEMTFSGIGFRQFSFNFVFRARNEKEVEVIQQIIETFRYYSKPTYTHGKAGFFSYPEEFLIEFLMKITKHGCDVYETNPYIPQIKMCVLKTVTTNFAPQNAWRSFEDSSPVEISLALSFEETEVVTGEDVVGETYVGRFKDSGRRF